ncbi:MAG: hypothetical protein A3C38_01590 [Planctomycetes bacterium RIFCSPHIGHO2_02_FULL_50_42]|nr:MAG: hypothetical protein A3C38_01590 [Planctomycetes bacterium RIFCSPHIGHO2_02_FULL_50_42]OHB95105.1 MAG: hypothetical protein A3I59_03540 [Planctomycetes bacterium RIFCSPLOWO2_02_FULL_50_16]OHC02296.1 MAG: hypothetical protein A3G17_08525 [Planctomycetes bacterium RIFCSPLOWO2_12_FULL_50_35]
MKNTLIVILMVLVLYSCASVEQQQPSKTFPPDYTGPAIMEATPWEVTLISGSTDYIYVTVMDQHRNPLPGQTVTISFDHSARAVAYLQEDQCSPVTNQKGQAWFVIAGKGFPNNGNITLSCGEASTTVEVWTRGYSPYGGRGG